MPEQLLPSVSSDVLAQQYQIDEPDLVNYSEWAIENATDENEARNRVNYSNFVRQEYIKHGTYDSAKSAEVVEKDLQQGLINSLSELGLDDEQKLEALAPQQKSLDDKLALIKAHHSSDSEEWNVATRYQAHQSALANSGDDGMSNPLIAEKTQQYLTEAEEIASGDAYNKALRRAVDTGELSMAVVKNEKGEDYIHSGKLLDELSFSDAMKQAVSVGNMSYEQAIQARGLYDQVDGTGLARHKVDRYNQIGHELNELSNSDENFKFQVEKFQEMQGRFDEQTEDLTDDQIAKRNLSIDRMYSVMTSLHPDGEEPSYDDFSAMMTTMAQRNNFHQQELYEADSENVGKNLKRIGHLPPMMTGVAMANRDVFEATIAANKSLTTEEVDMLRTQREELREANFGYHNKFLKQSRVGEEWMDALTKGRANGVNDADIFDEFVADPDNYSEFSTVARGIGASVVEGFTDVLGFVAMSAGADWGKEMLLDNARDKAQRVEFQEMFGDKYGFWQQSGEMIAPVLVDMGATALLATATLPAGGVGGAAYLASKTGARLSVKGLVKNMSKGVLRQQAGELPEEAAKRLLVTDMIKGSSKKVREEGAMAAIRGYNELLATKTLAKNTAVAIPAFNRSAGGTYASVYQKLGEDKSLSEEDRHDKAMGAAIAAGTTTALITVGFSSLGLGGVEDALIKGATKKQMMGILSPIVNRGGAEMTEGTFNGVMKEVMKVTIQKYGSGNFVKGMARGAAEEFPEEALDQFVNTFIEDAATDDDTPLMDNLQQALMAGLHGAVMGAGIPAVQNVAGAFTAKQRINEMGSQIQDQFYVDVANKLAESDSPLTAGVVKQLAMQPARKREAMYTGIKERVSAYKENKKQEAEQKQRQKEIKDGQEEQLDLGLDDDIRVSKDTVIPKGTPKKKAGSLAVKINEANRLQQQEFDFAEQEETAAEKPVVERNTDGSRSKSGRESASDEVDGDEILVADFTEQLSDNGVEEDTIQEFEAYLIDKLPDDSDDFKQRQDWQKMWDDFTVDTVEDQAPEAEPTPEVVDADTAPEAEEETTPRVERANERKLREGIERAAQERDQLLSAKDQTVFKLDSKKQLSQVKRNEQFTVVTESGEEMHRVIANEPATYAIEEIHSDLFEMGDIIGQEAMLPNEVRPALESEEARILTVERPDGSTYYISGEKNGVVSGSAQIAKSAGFLEFEGPNAQDSSIVAYPSAEVTSVTANESMTELDDPADLRLIEQEANNRLMADPFDRAAAIQKDYIQKRLRSEGEQTVDEVAFDEGQRQQGKKNVARAMKSIKAAAKAQKEEGRVPEQPRRQLTPTEMQYQAPQAYLEVTQGLQVDELSDEALSELVPIEQIEARRIPAVKQGLAQDQQDLKNQQINTLRNIIFLGYPVSIGSKMFGMLPQSEAKVGGYSSVIQEQTSQEVSSYKKYFRLKVAEKIERLYPKIDLRKVAGERGATIDPAYDPQIKNIAKSKKFPVRSYSYVVNESGEVELSDAKETSYYVDADGVGIFNNDPIAIGQMIAHGVPIRVPKNVINNFGKDSSILSASQINPSIRYDKVTGEVMRVVKPAADGIGVETIERKSAIGEILPDTQFSDLTYDLNSMFDNEGVRQIRVPSTSMASDTGPVSKEHYIVTNKAKEQHSLKELQRGFDLFTNSAMRGLAIIKSDQQVSREDQQIAAEFDSPEEASADRSSRDSNAKRAAWHMNKILGLTEAAGVRKLNTNEASEAFAIFVSEYQLALTSHAIRKDMSRAGHIDETENLIKPSREAQAIQKFKELSGKENDIEQLVTRLGGRMIAPQDSYSVTSKKYLDMSAEQKAERNDSIILAFLNKQIVGNAFLANGQMPTMQTVANRAKDRMLGQRKKQGDAFYESVDVPLDEISPEAGAQLIADESVNPEDIPYNVASNEPEFAGATSTEGLPKGISDEAFVDLQKKMLLDIISESNDTVIETIKTDDVARKAFIDMLRRTTHFGQNRADLFYDNMNVEAEWGAMSGAVAHATYAHSEEVLTFIKGLKEGTLSSGLDLRSTIKYVMFPNNVSDSYAEQMQPYLARQGIGIGTDPSFLPQVKTILNKTSEVLRIRYAMTATTEADRPQVVAQNTAEAEALGLVNGDSSSVVGALQNIASDSNNESHQLVAELLLEDKAFIQSVEFHISENSTLVPAQHTKNANGSHTVSINLGGSNGRGLENVLLEEYMHAFLSDVVARPEASLTPSQRSGISRLKGLMQLAQDAYTKSGENNESIAYQFKNMDEFVAGLLLNPEFQTFIKSVETPATQRGLFQRIADAIVSLFQRAAGRKITPQEAVSYADAVKDVIDLAQSEANSGRQNMVVGASSAINDNAKRRAASGLDKYGLDGSEDLSLTPEQAKEIEDSENRGRKREANLTRAQQEAQDPALYAKSATDADIDAEEISDFMSNDILPFLRAFLPAEMRLVVDHTLTSSMGQSGNVLYVNPARLADVIFAVSGDGVNNRDSINLSLLAILDEEVGHYASFNQLTQKEIDDMGDTMGVDALAAVAKRYFQRPTDVEAAIERLNSTDKAVALREKRNMVEEHLRMQLQRATRGFTTEEDIAFYQTNPPMRKILFRYLQGYLKTVAFRYRNRKEKPMAPINRLIAEMRQVKAGYRAGSNVQLFDPENPTANMQILNSMLNEPIVAEVEQAMGLVTMEQEIDARFGIQGTSAGLRDQDSDYLNLAKNPEKNKAKLQAMVDARAKETGYRDKGLHSTWIGNNEKPFDVFNFKRKPSLKTAISDWGVFFTPNQDVTPTQDMYAFMAGQNKVGGKARHIKAWLNMKNPKEVSREDFYKFMDFGSLDTQEYKSLAEAKKAAKAYKDEAVSQGHDGFIIGGSETVVFSPNQIKSSDPVTYDSAGNVIPLSQRFDTRKDSMLYSSAGLGARLDEKMFGERSLDFDHIPQMFEVPFMKAGEYKAPTNWWVKNMMGDADPRLTRLSDVRQGQINEGVATLKKFDIKFKQLLKQSYGDESNYPKETIAKAIGTNAGVDLDQSVLTELNDERASRLDEVFSDKSLDAAAKKEARQDVYDLMDAKRDALLRARADSLRVEQETALDDIRRDAPELAKYIGIMRTKLIDELSKVMVDKYGINNTPLGIRVDNQLGIYITRTYKMFTEVGYHQKVKDGIQKNEGDYAQIRAEAISYFEQQYIANRTEINIKRGMDSASAEKEARNELTQNSTFGYDALLTFIDSYDNQSVNKGIQSSEGYRILMDNLKKKEFPEQLRAVLGENTDVEKGLTNLLHTYGTVMNMVANQTFLTNIASVGRAENVPNAKPEDKFLMTQAELREAKEADPEKYKDWIVSEDRSSRNDPLAGLYAPKEMWDHLKMMTDKQMHNEMISSAEQTTRAAGVIAAKLTGLSMGVKTLGSFGFYLRNVMSNILYFGPSQGFVNVPKMLKSAAKHLSQTLLNPEEVDAQLLEYTGLLIIGDNMNTKLLHDLIRGRVEVDDIKKQMREEEAKHKSLDKFSSAVKAGTKKLTDMADAVDSFYKIAYFENELKVLRSAKKDAPAGSTYYNMSDQQLKTEAARKVLMTAQFASQRVELAKKVSNNAFGLLFSPFIGFTSDVFRIPVNTVKLAKEEMSSESSIIQKRGKQRAAGLASVGLGLSVVLPAALTSLLGGLDREEQDALRESLPEYLRSHSILYWKSGGKLQSMDLTYINPFAMLVDPFVRATEKLSMGEYRKASAALTIDFLAESFLSDQILAGALFDLKQNRNSTTGESIYDPNADDFGDISGKLMSYFYKKAAEPNTFLKIKESWQRKGLDTENFNDSSMGQLLSMAYPAKIHTLDLDRSFRRMLFSEKQSAINAKSQLFEVYQSKPMTDEAVSQIYLDHYERQTRLDSRMYKFLNAYESMGMSRQDMRHRLVKFGYGKRRADNILSGISEAPSLSPKMMASLQERGLLDRAGPLYQASYEVPQWRLLDPR